MDGLGLECADRQPEAVKHGNGGLLYQYSVSVAELQAATSDCVPHSYCILFTHVSASGRSFTHCHE